MSRTNSIYSTKHKHHITPQCELKNHSKEFINRPNNIVTLSWDEHKAAHKWLYMLLGTPGCEKAYIWMSNKRVEWWQTMDPVFKKKQCSIAGKSAASNPVNIANHRKRMNSPNHQKKMADGRRNSKKWKQSHQTPEYKELKRKQSAEHIKNNGNPANVKISVDGVIYENMKGATKQTPYTYDQIVYRSKSNRHNHIFRC